MRRLLSFGTILLLLASTAAVAADKAPLTDSQMATVTAGSGYAYSASGAVVANDSSATISNSYGVALSGYAEDGAKGVNIFNATTSKVGAGLNIMSLGATPYVPGSTVNQSNVVVQQAPVTEGASLSHYQRGADLSIGGLSLGISSTDTKTQSASDTFSKSSDLSVHASDTTKSSFAANQQFHNSKTLNVSAADNTSASLTTGFQAASDKTFTGNAATSTTAGGSAYFTHNTSPGPATSTTAGVNNAYFTHAANGAVSASDTKSASGGLSASYGNDKSFGLAAADTTSASSSVRANYYNDKTFSLNDKKSLSNAFTESSSDASTFGLTLGVSNLVYRGPMSLGSASAQNIVVDGSSLSDTETYAINLSGSAEQGATGVNIVNAVASLVGIGNNVSAAGANSNLDHFHLNQSNVIIQK